MAAAVALVSSGCGLVGDDNLPATVDAEGVITLDGQTIERAQIVLLPIDGSHPARGISDARGRFALKAFEAKDGAVPGSYRVRVSRTIEVTGDAPDAKQLGDDAEHMSEEEKAGVQWVNDLPTIYADPVKSGLTLDIPPEGTDSLELKLVSN